MNTLIKPPSILVADDQDDVLIALRMLFKSENYQAKTVSSPGAVLQAIKKQDFDVVLLDLNYTRDTTSGKEGIDLIGNIRKIDSRLPIVVMTAWATVDIAVECMRRGASDFIQKPWDNARLLTIIATQTEYHRTLNRNYILEEENRILRNEKKSTAFIAQSRVMKPIIDMIERIGPSDANVLITGDNGTGKGVVAETLHNQSLRAGRPFVSVNMGGLAAGVFESELFGHVKGAFTDAKADRAGRFELADTGTLFMDEIANVPMEQQNKLLRLIETGQFERVGSSKTRQVDVRLISATNANLEDEVSEGRFRQDLLYRLNTIHIHLPPLCERLEDIPLLATHFLNRHVQKYRKNIKGFSREALDCLLKHSWPGNIRELDHTVERGVLMALGGEVQQVDLCMRVTSQGGGASLDDMNLDEVEEYLIQRTLKRNGGNATKAAKALGLSRSAFYRRLQRFGL